MAEQTNERLIADLRDGIAEQGLRNEELAAELAAARAELAKRCDLDDCEAFREWLSGEKANADKRARRAERERDEQRERADGAERAHDQLLATNGDLVRQVETAEGERDEARAAWLTAQILKDTAEGERDKARAEVKRLTGGLANIQARVHRAFADADGKDVDLNAMTVTQLTSLVMAGLRGEEATDGG